MHNKKLEFTEHSDSHYNVFIDQPDRKLIFARVHTRENVCSQTIPFNKLKILTRQFPINRGCA
jgi:hypothetical protein